MCLGILFIGLPIIWIKKRIEKRKIQGIQISNFTERTEQSFVMESFHIEPETVSVRSFKEPNVETHSIASSMGKSNV